MSANADAADSLDKSTRAVVDSLGSVVEAFESGDADRIQVAIASYLDSGNATIERLMPVLCLDHETARAAGIVLLNLEPPPIDELVCALTAPDENLHRHAAALLQLVAGFDPQLLIQRLNSQNTDQLIALVGILVDVGAPAIDALIEALGEESATVRKCCGIALSQMGAQAAGPLTQALFEANEVQRSELIRTLIQIGADAAKHVVGLLAAENHGVRDAALTVLSNTRQAAIPALVPLLASSNNTEVAAAASLLIYFGRASVESVIALLGHDSQLVKDRARRVLEEIGEPALYPLVKAIRDDAETVGEGAAETLLAMADKTIDGLVHLLGCDDTEDRAVVVRLLVWKGPTVLRALVDGYESASDEAKAAIRAVVQLMGPSAVEPLLDIVSEDTDWPVSGLVPRLIADVGASAVEPLVTHISGQHTFRSSVALTALTFIGDPVLPHLKALMAQPDPLIRRQAGLCLLMIRSPESRLILAELGANHPSIPIDEEAARISGAEYAATVNAVIRLAADPDPDCSEAAQDLLAHGGDRVLPLLLEALVDADEQVAFATAKTLAQIGAPALGPLVDYFVELSRDGGSAFIPVPALVLMGRLAVRPMIDLLKTGDRRVMGGAAAVLIGIGRLAVDDLVFLLADRSATLRKEAVWILGKTGSPALPSLITALHSDDKYMGFGAMLSLIQIGEPSVPALVQEMKGGDGEIVRERISTVLSEIGAAAVPDLLALGAIEDEALRRLVVKTLALIGVPSADIAGSEFRSALQETEALLAGTDFVELAHLLLEEKQDFYYRRDRVDCPDEDNAAG